MATPTATMCVRGGNFLEKGELGKTQKTYTMGLSEVNSIGDYWFLNFFNVYLFLRERQRERERTQEEQRQRETEYEAGSRLRAVSPKPGVGLEPTNCKIMT